MKKFESIVDAMREIRSQTKELSSPSEHVYLGIDYYGENFYVTDDDLDLSEEIVRNLSESAWDISPEEAAKEWSVFEYSLAENKLLYPSLYRFAKEPSFKSTVELVREKKEIEPEYSVAFNFR